MRHLLPLCVLLGAVGACRCGPDVPTPVTFVVENPLEVPIYVDQTDGRMGMVIQRDVGGEWLPFVETPACECLSCQRVCDATCVCPQEDPAPRVMKVGPGQSFSRTWAGQVQVSLQGGCGPIGGEPPCLSAENPPLDESFRLELCYAYTAPGAEHEDGGVAVPGSLPEGRECVRQAFTVRDGEVRVGARRGAACETHADCEGEGELCFNGGCTVACPAPDFPRLGGAWQVRVAEPDNQGFFTVTQGEEESVWTGTGAATSVRYDHNTMTVQLLSGAANRGTLYVSLPQGVAVPLTLMETLQVTVVDRSTDENPENRAVVIKDQEGAVLLVADTAQKGAVLAAGQTAPFTVAPTAQIVGCETTTCGRNLFHTTRFESSEGAWELGPGTVEEVVAHGQVWLLSNVANERYPDTWCTLDEVAPYVIANQRAEGGGE